MPTSPHVHRRHLKARHIAVASALSLIPMLFAPLANAQRAVVATHTMQLTATTSDTAVDTGALPVSQPLSVTLRLTQTPAQTAALDQLLTDLTTSSSPKYHKWLTPQQYAADFGATDDQLATLSAWAQSQGLTVASVSAGKTRVVLSGTAGQVQQAFATSLHSYFVTNSVYYANTTQPSVPLAISPLVASIAGLDDLPSTVTASIAAVSAGHSQALAASTTDPLTTAASAIDANTSSILSFNTTACSTDYAQSDIDAYRAAFRQANAQGITVLATSACGTRGTGSFPASLPEVTAIVTSPESSTFVAIEPRPGWQVASGLPDDAYRHEPDLTSSVAAFSQTLTGILQQAGTREGNINATLYSLANTPDLYTQPDGAPAGTWESATGLGTVNLSVLAKVFPRDTGSLTTTTSLVSSSYALNYGDSFTLTAKVLAPVYGTAAPTGNVTFSAAAQGVLGTATIDSSGTATFVEKTALPVGTYNVTATYSGDTNYAGSSNTSSVILTVSIVNATLVATIAPAANVPYGSTATITATVTLPGVDATPTGTVTAVVEGITGSSATATLSPNPGGNSATTNININAPTPSTMPYTVSVTCAGTANFQCQTPQTPTFTTTKGNTSTTLSLTPAAPQAGQPVTITATINNNGNGTGTYTFSGNVTFSDSTTNKILATVPVGTNQAATSQTLSGNVQHNIIATYTGDANWNGSASNPQAVTPTLLPSTLTLSANTTNTLAGVNLVLTATVFTTVTNTVGPTGTVTFYDTFNNQVVQLGASTAVTPNGPNQSIAIFTTTGLLAGTHSIYAIYNGDSNFAPATAATLSINLSDYNVTALPQTLTLKAGQTGQVVLLVGLVGGFSGTVSFGCTPPSGAEATCSFSQVSLQGGGSTTMTITTTAAATTTTGSAKKGDQQASRREHWGLAGGSALAMLLCFSLPRRRRALPFLLTSLLALSLSSSLGCGIGLQTTAGSGSGSGGGTSTTDPGTPLGTQIFTITTAGNDGTNTVRHNYQYQVTVQ